MWMKHKSNILTTDFSPLPIFCAFNYFSIFSMLRYFSVNIGIFRLCAVKQFIQKKMNFFLNIFLVYNAKKCLDPKHTRPRLNRLKSHRNKLLLFSHPKACLL